MDEATKGYCVAILNELLENPVAHNLWGTSSDLSNAHMVMPLDLKVISERLSRNLYGNSVHFVEDLHKCINNSINGYPPNSIRHVAALQLQEELDELVMRVPLTTIKRENIHGILQLSQIGFFEGKIPTLKEGKPMASIFGDQPQDINFLLKCLAGPDMLRELYVYLTNLQPEAVSSGPTLSLNLSVLTDENKQKTSEFLMDILRTAASGKTNPFTRPFGIKTVPIVINERGSLY